MLFNSFEYLFIFFPVVAVVYHILSRSTKPSWSMDWIIGSSVLFYTWGRPRDLPVLACSILFNYLITRAMGPGHDESETRIPLTRCDRRRLLLVFGIVANVLLLCAYKYIGFGLVTLGQLTGHSFNVPTLSLPLGISFFTLQQVIYLVDCYERLTPPNSLRAHMAFVSFFPCVSMGPIIQVKTLLSQLEPRTKLVPLAEQLAPALLLIGIGLFKKVVLADSFARIADAGFDLPNRLSTLEAWASSISYSLQLYYDFSGYSDLAIGSALALGIRIPANFNDPYRSRSIIEFWRRWHISLSNFITAYLYTPIVRSFRKLTFAKAMLATFLSMLIAGLWHGASWNFVVFGGLHGLGLVVNQTWKKRKRKLPAALAWFLTAVYVNLAFVFFRSPSISKAFSMVTALFSPKFTASTDTLRLAIRGSEFFQMAIPLALGLALPFARKASNQIAEEFRPTWFNLSWATAATLAALTFLNSNMAKSFLYFNF